MPERLRQHLAEPVDGRSVAVFRAAFGFLMAASAVRFVANGWVERFFGDRAFFFRYWGFEWVPPLPVPGMTALYLGSAVAALALAAGWRTRASAAAFLVAFGWTELVDVTNYLNHYYLVTLVAVLFVALPTGGAPGVSNRFRAGTVPRLTLHLLRFQFATVYLFAGLAKLEPDWLLHGQPLGIWLAARDDFPVLGPLFRVGWVPVAMSWLGCLHDLLIVPALLWKRSRPWAFAALVGFHALTGALFTIGIFPILMPLGATLFFEPDWPARVWRRARRLVRGRPVPRPTAPALEGARAPRLPAAAVVAAGAFVAFQLLVPLRTHLYGPGVLWHEQGMRWSWRVMLREKNGSLTYRVRADGWPRERLVSARDYLTAYQEREMSGQPDLVAQLARHVAAEYRARGSTGVEVRVDAFASLNGRPPARLIDPQVDLARVGDGMLPAAWILPAPEGPPLRSSGVRVHASLP